MSSENSEAAVAASTDNSTIKVSIELPHAAFCQRSKKDKSLVLQFSKDAKVQTVLDILAYAQQTKHLTNIGLKTKARAVKEDELLLDIVGGESAALSLHLQVVAKPYTAREVIRHVLTTRDLLGFASEGIDGLSEYAISTASKFGSMPFDDIKKVSNNEKKDDDGEAQKDGEEQKNELYVSAEERQKFANTVHEIFAAAKSANILSFFSSADSNIVTPCVRSISLSPYNPVPALYRTKGHLLYLQITTLEAETFQITAVPTGFYINKSSSGKFDPMPKELDESSTDSYIKYTLFDLLATHSKKFLSHVEKLDKKFAKFDSIQYTKPVTATLHKPWVVPSSATTNVGDYFPYQLEALDFNPERNFNDEFQAIRDLPVTNIQSRINSERLFSKIAHEFTMAATKGAMSIFYGDMLAMNPDAPTEEQIFLKGNVFYSYVVDVAGLYATRGGNEAAMAAANQDLKTINIMNTLNLKDVHYLLTTIVDFAGRRILAQTPVPGLFTTMGTQVKVTAEDGKEVVEDLPNDVVVKYGFDETSGKVLTDADFDASIQKEFSKVFHVKPHKINENQVSFASQSKGIIGFDKRKYVMDLANTYPLDITFVREYYDNASDAERYPHRQTLLRPELVEKWWNNKVEQENLEIEKAYDEGKFAYNPDAYQVDGIEDPIVEEMSNYLSSTVLPSLLEDYVMGNCGIPYNGEHLVDTLHRNGVNLRYLGTFVILAKQKLAEQELAYSNRKEQIAKDNLEYEQWEKEYLKKIEKRIIERQKKVNELVSEGKEVPKELTGELQLDESEIRKPVKDDPVVVSKDELLPLIAIGELEIFTRSLKHVLRKYTSALQVPMVSSFIAFVFNLLFGTAFNPSPKPEGIANVDPAEAKEFSELTREQLLQEVVTEAKRRFRYSLPIQWIEKFNDSPFIVMSSISIKFGIQWLNKEYFFTRDSFEAYKQSQDKKIRGKIIAPENTFSMSDLIIIPRVKGFEYSSVLSNEFWAQGAELISKDQKTALALLSQSIAIKEEVNSALHPSVAEKYLSMSTIYSKIGLIPEAIAFCRKACAIYERVTGVDSFEVLRGLLNLTILETTNGSPYNAAVALKRIVEITQGYQMSTKLQHSALVNAYTQLEQLSQRIKDPKLTLEVSKQLSALVMSQEGNESLSFAYTESRLGNLYASMKDFHNAFKHISATEGIFAKELGLNHMYTMQSKQWINGLNNLIQNEKQQKQMAKERQISLQQSKTHHHGSKPVKPNPELAEKSVDELLNFIEGATPSKNKKKKSKKGKSSGKN